MSFEKRFSFDGGKKKKKIQTNKQTRRNADVPREVSKIVDKTLYLGEKNIQNSLVFRTVSIIIIILIYYFMITRCARNV